MKSIFLLGIIFFNFQIVRAATPTVEGLFRNGNNAIVEANLCAIKFMVEEHSNDKNEIREDKKSENKINEVRYFKLIFRKDENDLNLLHLRYNSSSMSSNSLEEIIDINNLQSKIVSFGTYSRELFYSLIYMYSFNDSMLIRKVLKKHNNNFKSNEELINQEKASLLEKYKEYLIKKNDINRDEKEKEKEKEELMSPLEPKDDEDIAKVNNLLSRNMYNKSHEVRLIRNGRDFFWEVKLENLNGLFVSENHHLRKIQFSNEKHELTEFIFGNYMLFDGIHELPKRIIIRKNGEIIYELRILGLKLFQAKRNNTKKRLQRYEKILSNNISRGAREEEIKNPFTFLLGTHSELIE